MNKKNLTQQNAVEFKQSSTDQHQANRCVQKYDPSLLNLLPHPVVILHQNNTVDDINPAFENLFGWTLEELKGEYLPFVPDSLKTELSQSTQRLLKEKTVPGFEIRGLTKSGRILDLVCDGAALYEEEDGQSRQVLFLRDITHGKHVIQSNQTLFRISEKLHHFQRLDELLEFITEEIHDLIKVEGTMVILLDKETQEFFFRVATLDDIESEKK